jgi:phage tail sheath gpL-like
VFPGFLFPGPFASHQKNFSFVLKYQHPTHKNMASDAVGLERISRVVGYKIKKGNFRPISPNLPQRIAIFAEANEANQVALDTDPIELLSAQQAGEEYGYGSPMHMIMRILKPVNGDGIGGIPVYGYAQAKAVGGTQRVLEIEATGVATGNGTHTVMIAGRAGVDGIFYDINIVEGDTQADIAQKISDAVNAVLGSPVLGEADDYVATLTSKWAGLTANEITAEVTTGDDDLGITYSVSVTQAGAGTPSIAAALALFQNNWNTIVINSYGTVTAIMNALENFNGIPSPENPTGRYTGIMMKPFIAITGSVAEDPSGVTDGRLNDVTIAIAPAPLSEGLSLEAAANMAYLFAIKSEQSPHQDVCGQYYPDMPTPDSIGTMDTYNNRDAIVKKGCSTVSRNAGRYLIEDFVTTYHPVGEVPPQFRYCRNLMLDFNVRYGYYLLELQFVVDHVIARDKDVVTASKVVKPMGWKQKLNSYADDLTARALINEPDFMKDSIEVGLSTTNPDRLETFFRYKRSGTVRISSTDAEAGFNFGT